MPSESLEDALNRVVPLPPILPAKNDPLDLASRPRPTFYADQAFKLAYRLMDEIRPAAERDEDSQEADIYYCLHALTVVLKEAGLISKNLI